LLKAVLFADEKEKKTRKIHQTRKEEWERVRQEQKTELDSQQKQIDVLKK
jgi:gas vesicle protein